jgi:hypothetical protein
LAADGKTASALLGTLASAAMAGGLMSGAIASANRGTGGALGGERLTATLTAEEGVEGAAPEAGAAEAWLAVGAVAPADCAGVERLTKRNKGGSTASSVASDAVGAATLGADAAHGASDAGADALSFAMAPFPTGIEGAAASVPAIPLSAWPTIKRGVTNQARDRSPAWSAPPGIVAMAGSGADGAPGAVLGKVGASALPGTTSTFGIDGAAAGEVAGAVAPEFVLILASGWVTVACGATSWTRDASMTSPVTPEVGAAAPGSDAAFWAGAPTVDVPAATSADGDPGCSSAAGSLPETPGFDPSAAARRAAAGEKVLDVLAAGEAAAASPAEKRVSVAGAAAPVSAIKAASAWAKPSTSGCASSAPELSPAGRRTPKLALAEAACMDANGWR